MPESTPPRTTGARDIDSIRKAIKSIKLPPPPPDEAEFEGPAPRMPMPKFPANTDQGFVNCGSIQSLGAELSAEAKENSLWWTLFAQVGADALLHKEGKSRESHPDEWYDCYIDNLIKFGMDSVTSERHRVGSSSIKDTVDATVLGLVGLFLNPRQLQKITDIIGALNKAASERVLTLFNTKASNNSSANFQISDTVVDQALTLSITSGYMNFTTSQKITRMLFWKWTDTRIDFYAGNDTLTLEKWLADEVREDVFNAIKDFITTNIGEVPLPNY
ncbi:hypothetical protein F5887DRAFT_180184 [Amanita rubescens]|nr:hypothetical protein F5887DRAFT_180184 [Amanita rubescens]